MPFIPSNDKFFLFTQNIPQNHTMLFNNNPKISRFPNVGDNNNNNNNNKISTDSNSIHSYSINQSNLSANSAFKKSSSSSGSDSRRNFQPRVGAFNFNNTDLNKQFFLNMNNKI